MADEQTKSSEQPQAQPQGNQQPNAQMQEPGPVPYERFKQINDQLQQLRAAQDKADAAAKASREKELAEQQKWQQLYEQRELELKSERLTNARLRISASKGLPADLIDFLQGDSEETITANAEKLLQFIAKPAAPAAPGVPPGNRNAQPARLDVNNMTPEEIRKNAAKLYGQTRQ